MHPETSLWRAIAADTPPAYRAEWDLARDPKLEEAVIYLASLNSTEPACTTMLGVVSLKNEDLNLAATAFDRAASMGSPSAAAQRQWTRALLAHITRSQAIKAEDRLWLSITVATAAILVLLGAAALWAVRRRTRNAT